MIIIHRIKLLCNTKQLNVIVGQVTLGLVCKYLIAISYVPGTRLCYQKSRDVSYVPGTRLCYQKSRDVRIDQSNVLLGL